ncbi:MAG: hypothetical protein GOV00_03260 [Candidatus Altiarchaeota archaeon]|nr:hypothetical protein [Candidatus Altiarchaeota archaeon]
MKKSGRLYSLFLHSKPAEMLIKIKEGNGDKYASVLAKEVDCTYSHCVRIVQQMSTLKLVEFRRAGRIKIIKLTKFGQDVAVAIENLTRVFNRG